MNALLVVLALQAPWRPADYRLAGAATAAMTADCVTTVQALDRGAEERNPFLGRRPGTLGVVSGCVFAWATTLVVADALPPQWRRRVLGGLSLLGFALALHNLRQAR